MDVTSCMAVITGGASGLGEACVRLLAGRGAKVAIFDVAAERGENLASELGSHVTYISVDITAEDQTQAAISRVVAALGGISVLINCAGVGDPGKLLSKRGPLPLSAFNRVLQINLVGTLNVTRLAVEQMVKNTPNKDGERGIVINTASIAAFDGQIGQVAYSASKAGVVGMTLPLARECAEYGVRVVTIAPGLFDTPLLALLPSQVREFLAKTIPFPQRLGHPMEYARLVEHVIGNAMLNGECIRLDGALRMAAK